MSEEAKQNSGATEGQTEKKPPKPPKPEDKPFPEFIEQEYIPALEKALDEKGISDLQLQFVKQKFPPAIGISDECWQVTGQWQQGQRKFNVYFPNEDIKAQKFFSCTSSDAPASSLELFLGDERRITRDLMVFGVVQRLNAQKWLTLN
ncbi:MAG: DUF2996 domain-containing protein [Microcoleaceae cyanobacterium]